MAAPGTKDDLPAAPVPSLRGRDEALAAVRGVLASTGHALVVLGEAGSGKTSLLEVASVTASDEGWNVLRLEGRRSDVALPLIGLHDLLRAADALSATAPAARDAADVLQVLVRDGGSREEQSPLRIRLDVLTWLQEVAELGPLLVVVDDLQWVDSTTRAVLAFVAHRARGTGVSLLLAARGSAPKDDALDLPTIALRGLTDDEAAAVLGDAGLTLTKYDSTTVVSRAAGNPLALLEFGRAVQDSNAVFSDEIDIPARLQRTFSAELQNLPRDTQALLLMVAAGGDDLRTVASAVGPGKAVSALTPAERAGLVVVSGERIRFRHPLVQDAVYSAATTRERIETHAALAAVYTAADDDRRAWHRAAAQVLPDESVAQELAAAADRALHRGAFAEAARALNRAAELSPDPVMRDRRRLDAFMTRLSSGQIKQGLEAVTALRDRTDRPEIRALAQHTIAYALTQTMQQEAAHAALDQALDLLVDDGDAMGWGSLTTLAALTYQTGEDPQIVRSWLERYDAAGLPPEEPATTLIRSMRAWILAAADPIDRPKEAVTEVRVNRVLPGSAPAEMRIDHHTLLGSAAWLLDCPEDALRHLRLARHLAEEAGVTWKIATTLTGLAPVELDRVALDDADEVGRMMHDIAEAEDLEYLRAVAGQVTAAAAALRGDRETARAVAGAILSDPDVDRVPALATSLRLALARSWFGEDDEARYTQLRLLFDETAAPRHGRVSIQALPDLAAAAVRTGRTEDARAVVDRVAALLPETPSSYQRLALTRTRALLEPVDGDAEKLFNSVLLSPDAHRWPFELAGTRLEFGAWLRRRQRPTAARQHLQQALDVFERLGTAPWADVARAELRAAGVAATAPAPTAWSDLTPQQRQVVRLAAKGRTNREIGQAMFLSHRTVSAHLYNAFPKLGVTARSQLRDLVDLLEGAHESAS